MIIIQVLREEIISVCVMNNFVKDIWKFLSYYGIFSVSYFFRKGNKKTDWIVNDDYYYADEFEWIIFPLLQFDNIFKTDRLGISFERRVF